MTSNTPLDWTCTRKKWQRPYPSSPTQSTAIRCWTNLKHQTESTCALPQWTRSFTAPVVPTWLPSEPGAHSCTYVCIIFGMHTYHLWYKLHVYILLVILTVYCVQYIHIYIYIYQLALYILLVKWYLWHFVCVHTYDCIIILFYCWNLAVLCLYYPHKYVRMYVYIIIYVLPRYYSARPIALL